MSGHNLDIAWYLYTFTGALSLYGFGLFFWWLLKKKRASAAYVYVMLMLLGIAGSSVGSSYVRWFKVYKREYYLKLLDSWWWSARLWILLFAVMGITLHMSYRAFVLKRR